MTKVENERNPVEEAFARAFQIASCSSRELQAARKKLTQLVITARVAMEACEGLPMTADQRAHERGEAHRALCAIGFEVLDHLAGAESFMENLRDVHAKACLAKERTPRKRRLRRASGNVIDFAAHRERKGGE